MDKYFAEHAQLAKIVPQVCAKVRAAFGEHAELSLELYRDPEIDDRYLSLYVRQPAYQADIIEKIDAATEAFDDALSQCSGYLLVTSDFRRPGAVHAV